MKPLTLLANACWLAIAAMLIVGITAPMFTFSQFYFFNDTFSLLGGIFHLWEQGEVLLFVLLFCFSLVMPALKMTALLYAINSPGARQRQWLSRIAWLGKWSMLDVMVVAILAVTIKLGIVVDVRIHSGLYIFAIAVLLSMLLPMVLSWFSPPDKTMSRDTTTPRPHGRISFYQRFEADILAGSKTITLRDTPEAATGDLLDAFTHEEDRWFAKLEVLHVAPITRAQLDDSHARQENMTLAELHQVIEQIYPGQQQLYLIEFQRR